MNKTKNEIKFSEIRFEHGASLSSQLKSYLLDLIRSGRLKQNAKLPSVYELADMVGVSSTTVRKAVGELTREGYLNSIQGLGTFVFSDDLNRQKDTPRLSKNIGIVLPRMDDDLLDAEKSPWTWEILSSMRETLSSDGYFCTIFPAAGSSKRAEGAVLDNIDHFSGIVSFPDSVGSLFLEVLEECEKPYMVIGKWARDMKHSYVACDDYDLGRKAAGHLVETGCRSFLGVLVRHKNYYPAIREIAGFQEELLRRGIGADEIRISDDESSFTMDGFGSGNASCLGVFVTNEYFALDILENCRRLGKNIPGEIRVVGGVGTKICEHSNPTLTAIHQPMAQIGREAALNLIKLMRDNLKYVKGVELPGELAVRGSTGHVGSKRIMDEARQKVQV